MGKLEKSRKALALAEKYLGILEELAEEDPDAFRDSFVGAIAVIRRVGHVISHESDALGRTPAFSQWWKNSSIDPRYTCVKGARDLVLKEAGEGAGVRHQLEFTDGALASPSPAAAASTRIEVVNHDGHTEHYTFKAAVNPSRTEGADQTYRRTWVFASGDCAGNELLPVLRDFLAWMKDEAIPIAERDDTAGEQLQPGP